MIRGLGRWAMLVAALALIARTASADGIGEATVDGNSLQVDISVGGVGATLTVRFENVVGLSAANLGLSALAIDRTDQSLLSRLGPGASLPAGFPMLVRIEPPASGGLSFSGVVAIELYTHDLQYTVGSPLRLYSAPLGGGFSDVTTSVGSGSYRSGGTKGDFSEFLIVADVRSLATVIDAKYGQLSALLDQHASSIDAAVLAELANLAASSKAAFQQGALVAAIEYVEAFAEEVTEHSGSGIPDVWRSARDLNNVAGKLRAAAATLRFSLTLASNAP